MLAVTFHVEHWQHEDGDHLADVFWIEGARPCWDEHHNRVLSALGLPTWSPR